MIKGKKHSSWAEVAKAADQAAAQKADRRLAAPVSRPRPAAPPLAPEIHLALLRRVLASQKEKRASLARLPKP